MHEFFFVVEFENIEKHPQFTIGTSKCGWFLSVWTHS